LQDGSRRLLCGHTLASPVLGARTELHPARLSLHEGRPGSDAVPRRRCAGFGLEHCAGLQRRWAEVRWLEGLAREPPSQLSATRRNQVRGECRDLELQLTASGGQPSLLARFQLQRRLYLLESAGDGPRG